MCEVSKENVNVVKRIYEAFGKGDIPAVLEQFNPNIEWIAADNSPAAVGSPYHGLEAVRDGVFTRTVTLFDGFTIEVDELLDAGDKVVMLGYYLATHKVTGKKIRAQVAHIWTVSSGKAAKFQQYTDTYQLAGL